MLAFALFIFLFYFQSLVGRLQGRYLLVAFHISRSRLLFILFGFQEIKIRNNKRNGPRVNADQR